MSPSIRSAAAFPHFVVDAFAERPYSGNPAGVCLPGEPLDDATMLAIAAEVNLSETAFVQRRADGDFDLRWFTPTTEVDLCGHATLASGHVLLAHVAPELERARFHTRSGLLVVERTAGERGRYALELPLHDAERAAADRVLEAALGASATELWRRGEDRLVVVESERAVRDLQPDFRALAAAAPHLAIVTAPAGSAEQADFVSRVFAPAVGIDEDPVTGSAHALLAPFWARRLGRSSLRARQLSRRGGALECLVGRPRPGRVTLVGGAITVMSGEWRAGRYSSG